MVLGLFSDRNQNENKETESQMVLDKFSHQKQIQKQFYETLVEHINWWIFYVKETVRRRINNERIVR